MNMTPFNKTGLEKLLMPENSALRGPNCQEFPPSDSVVGYLLRLTSPLIQSLRLCKFLQRPLNNGQAKSSPRRR